MALTEEVSQAPEVPKEGAASTSISVGQAAAAAASEAAAASSSNGPEIRQATGAAGGSSVANGIEPPPVYAGRSIKQRVSYFYDHDVGNYSYGYGHPMKPHRMRMAHNLISNYGLQRYMQVLRPKRATPEEMTRFHTNEYIDFLKRVTPETVESLTGGGARFLTGEDCPGFEGLYEFCSISAGGSIAAAQSLNNGQSDIAINWAGGLHHAKKREASGFCYVNDIVLAILELLKSHLRVLYIDIDIHHGDGVEEAFYSTDRVLTASFHKYGDFFPGTGDVKDCGIKKGKGYSVNVPLRDGITDESFGLVFREVIGYIMNWYQPGAVVLQCGADSLAGDKLGCFNLSMNGHADCVRFMRAYGVPLIVVGGGGYTIRNVARTWTYETGILLDKELDEDLPYNEYMQYFGPEYKLDVPRTSMEDLNTREYLERLRTTIIENIKDLPFAPGVQMQEVPRTALVGAEANLSDDEDSDLDRRISRRLRDRHIDRYGDELTDEEEDDDSDTPMADATRHGAAAMARSSSHAAAFVLANGSRGGAPVLAASSGSKLKANGSAALGHDLATSYFVDRGAGGEEETDGARLLDALGNRKSQPRRPKRTFFANRAAASASTIAGAAQDLVAAQAAYHAAASSALNPRSISVAADTPAPSRAQLETWARGGAGKQRAGANGAGPGIWNGELIDSDAEDAPHSSLTNGVKAGRTYQRVGTGLAQAEQRQREMAGAA